MCAHYPERLRHLADPPLLLYAIGCVERLADPQIAIVGSRNASLTGCTTARQFAAALVGCGWSITSGLAEGIDASAHQGALLGRHRSGSRPRAASPDTVGVTLAVMGTGIDRVYPARHRPLAHRIAVDGVLVTEQPPGTRPVAGLFPRRNRLIAALSHAVVVVEAAARSGSLITAHAANDLGRDVLAVPGSIHSPLSRGCHRLIKEGAQLTESVDDILSALRLHGGHAGSGSATPLGDPEEGLWGEQSLSPKSAPEGDHADADRSPQDRRLLQCIGHAPTSFDQLERALRWTPGTLMAALQILEIDGVLSRNPGGDWVRQG